MRIETPNLRLRPLTAADAEALFATFGDPDTMKYWLNAPDSNTKETEDRIAGINAHWEEHGFGDWGIVDKETSDLVGLAGLHYIAGMDDINIGYAIEKQHWRRGYGLEACRAVLDYGKNALGLSHIVAVIWAENRASIRLVEKCGLRFWKESIWGGGDRLIYRIDFPG